MKAVHYTLRSSFYGQDYVSGAGSMSWLEVVGRHIVSASCMASAALMSDVSMGLLFCIWNVLWIKISITAALTNWQNILSEGADVWLPEQRWIASIRTRRKLSPSPNHKLLHFLTIKDEHQCSPLRRRRLLFFILISYSDVV